MKKITFKKQFKMVYNPQYTSDLDARAELIETGLDKGYVLAEPEFVNLRVIKCMAGYVGKVKVRKFEIPLPLELNPTHTKISNLKLKLKRK